MVHVTCCVHVCGEGNSWSSGLEGLVTTPLLLHWASDIAKHSHLKFREERSLFIYLFINLSPDHVPGTGLGPGDTVLNRAGTGPSPGSLQSTEDTDIPQGASSDVPRNSCFGLKGQVIFLRFSALNLFLVCLACYNRIPQPGCFINKKTYLTVLEAAKSKIKAPTNLVPGESPLLGLQMAFF